MNLGRALNLALRLEVLLRESTPPPWRVEKLEGYITGHVTSPNHMYCGNRNGRADSITAPDSMTRADADLIAFIGKSRKRNR